MILCVAAVLVLLAMPLAAQTPIPAQPVDPNQAIPAQPVEPAVPAAPVAPATPASPALPAASTNTAVPATVEVSVIADSSLRNVLQALAKEWADNQPDGPQVRLVLTNEGTLMAKVTSSPDWDVVINSDADDLKTLNDNGLVQADGQRSLARNTVVIYGRKALLKDEDEWFDMVGDEWKKVSLGNPDLVESGRVARRALQKHDLFDEDHQKIYVKSGTETQALQVVERDQADATFVYKTDLMGIGLPGFEVTPLDSVDAPPIFYTAAMGRLAKNPDGARSFITFCGSEGAREIWAKYGFEMN